MSAEEGQRAPSEEELRAAYERELSRLTSADVIAQSTVSLLNLAALRLRGGEGGAGRDLDQVRDAVDAASALLGILDRTMPGESRPLRDALARLQLAYAAEVGAAGGAPGEGSGPSGEEPQAPAREGAGTAPDTAAPEPDGEEGRRPGPAESSGRLWVPGR
jgi:hypothetical protein